MDHAIAELSATSALDDARFARLFAEDRRELEQWGSERIRRGLMARGIDRDLAEAMVTEAGAEDELERAVNLLSQRFPVPPRERRERDRALGLLIRKGYDAELSLDALATYARAAS